MEAIGQTLIDYEKTLFDKMFRLKHTHPPITGTVPECLYCRVHGNVFENGVCSVDTELRHFVVPMNSLLSLRKE